MANPSSLLETQPPPPPPTLTPAMPRDAKQPRWVVPVVVAALIVGLAGVGVGAYAVATTPAKTSGPQGAVGPRGATGPQGPQGVAGQPGVAGPAGTVAAVSIVQGIALKTTPNPDVGTTLAAKTSCPAGQVLLDGGAQVSAPGVLADRNVDLRSSYPYSATQWQTVAITTGPLGAGVSMTMKPYVVCGVPASTSSSTTTPTTS
jgi:hypothetical protein